MNEAHWHLALNHLPIIIPLTGILVMITGLWSKSEAIKRSAYMLFVVGSLTTILAMATGDKAEDLVENIVEISENDIEHHEELAEVFAVWSYLLGGVALIGLYLSFNHKKYSSILSVATLLLSFIVLYVAKNTATSGGEIRHSEIRTQYNTVKHHHD